MSLLRAAPRPPATNTAKARQLRPWNWLPAHATWRCTPIDGIPQPHVAIPADFLLEPVSLANPSSAGIGPTRNTASATGSCMATVPDGVRPGVYATRDYRG